MQHTPRYVKNNENSANNLKWKQNTFSAAVFSSYCMYLDSSILYVYFKLHKKKRKSFVCQQSKPLIIDKLQNVVLITRVSGMKNIYVYVSSKSIHFVNITAYILSP